jgi:hypothetical protein
MFKMCCGDCGECWYVGNPRTCKCPEEKPKHEWVGLTDEDLKPLSDKWRIVYGGWVEDFAKEIEAKLKEKNT